MAILTLKTLRAKDACADQRALFKRMFGDSVDVNVELCQKHSALFNWNWAARNLLNTNQRAEYRRITSPALAEYTRITDQAWAEYERITDQAWAEYERITGPARTEYERIRGQAWAEYKRIRGQAFAIAYHS